MAWEIDKTFSFCYGHRVWVQELNTEFTEAGHTKPKCRMMHGHEGMVQVYLSGDVDHRGMVEDFVNLGWIKDFLDQQLDHRFILDISDPWITNILNAAPILNERGELVQLVKIKAPTELTTEDTVYAVERVFVPGTDHFVGWNIDVSGIDGPEEEVMSGFFLVDFVPTSELLCKWLYDAVDAKMSKIGVHTSKISWNETPKSRAVYVADSTSNINMV